MSAFKTVAHRKRIANRTAATHDRGQL